MAEHLERWFECFGRESIRLLYQEDLETDQPGFVRDVCAALDVPYAEPSEEIRGRYNVASYSRFGTLALTAQKTADWLRGHQMYAVINAAKAVGLKRLIFGAERPDAKPHERAGGGYGLAAGEAGAGGGQAAAAFGAECPGLGRVIVP